MASELPPAGEFESLPPFNRLSLPVEQPSLQDACRLVCCTAWCRPCTPERLPTLALCPVSLPPPIPHTTTAFLHPFQPPPPPFGASSASGRSVSSLPCLLSALLCPVVAANASSSPSPSPSTPKIITTFFHPFQSPPPLFGVRVALAGLVSSVTCLLKPLLCPVGDANTSSSPSSPPPPPTPPPPPPSPAHRFALFATSTNHHQLVQIKP